MNRDLTVIVPCFNSGNTLPSLFLSLTSQLTLPTEVIFIDDCSGDNTVALLRAFSQTAPFRITILSTPFNQGAGASRNLGLEHVITPWLAFLDSDDLWLPSKLHTILEYISLYPSADLFFHDEYHLRLNHTLHKLDHTTLFKTNIPLQDQLYRVNFFSTSTVVIRTASIKAFRFDTTLRNGQDYELWLRIAPFISIKPVPFYLGVYRSSPNNISNTRRLLHTLNEIRISLRYLNTSRLPSFIFRLFRFFILTLFSLFR